MTKEQDKRMCCDITKNKRQSAEEIGDSILDEVKERLITKTE